VKSDAYKTHNQQQGKAMHSLKKIITLLERDVEYAKDDFHQDQGESYHLGIVEGLTKALNYVLKAQAKELTELDKWAQSYNRQKG